ncbi:MAG: lipopolysaccharide kinase InaA family protein [Candidatus Scalindua sp.]|nr:lipopolysaccharide kinase InaA family protein [Candidatus Scalindua sp.]MCR4344535.1 lipopolysaccharide kinase InaA family protein [Candidatus Scalindua sp.]
MSTKTTKNGTEWTVREGYEKISDRFNPDDLLSDLNGKQYTLVKENRVRSVISMPGSDISDNGIYIKYFKRGGYKEYIKHLFVPTKARTEWEVGNALLSKDINTALPLAISEGKRRLIIVTETVTNSEELMEFCQSNYKGSLSVGKESEKKILFDKLAVFIRDIHEKGFCHYDLHAGNILIRFKRKQNVSEYDLYLMDLHRVKIFKSISIRKRIHNLVQIFNSLSSIMTPSDKLDFVRSYGPDVLISSKNEQTQYQIGNHHIAPPSQGGDSKKYISADPSPPSLQGGDPKKHNSTSISSPPYKGGEKGEVESSRRQLDIEQSLVRQIDEQSSGIRNIHYQSRLKRCLKESSVFSMKKIANMKMFFRKGYDTDSLLKLIEKHNNILVNNDSTVIIKRDSKTVLTRHTFKDKTVQNVVVKRYRVGCPGCLIKNIFRGSAGRKAWLAGNGLRVYGFNTPLPLALIEKKLAGITTDSYVIMEEIKDSLEMDRYVLKTFNNRLETNQCKEEDHPTSPPLEGGEKGEVKNVDRTPPDTDQLYLLPRANIKKKRELISGLAKTLGEMHNHNIFHHDLKTCNVMVKEKTFDFTFLDFDKVLFNEEITVRKRVKNLVQINLSTPRLFTLADRVRFLKEYLDQCGITNEKKNNILTEVVNLSKTEKILYVSLNGDVTEDW